MGIDIYLTWDEQTQEERQAQYTGFDVTAGAVGYLREAYHGGPYVTEVLMPESFNDEGQATIPAATLRARLPEAIATAKQRSKEVYNEEIGDDHPVVQSFVAFVELAEKMEEEGRNPIIVNSY